MRVIRPIDFAHVLVALCTVAGVINFSATITVAHEVTAEGLLVTVDDEGPGIPARSRLTPAASDEP